MVIAIDAAFDMDSADSHKAATTDVIPIYIGGTSISITSVVSSISDSAELIF